MSRTVLTLDERQAKLENIASYDLVALEQAKVSELRELAKGLIPCYTRLKRGELFQELVDITTSLRNQKRLEEEAKEAALREQLLQQKAAANKLNLALQRDPEIQEMRQVQRQAIAPESPKDRANRVFERIGSILKTSGDLSVMRGRVNELVLQEIAIETSCYMPTTRKSNKSEIKAQLQARLQEVVNSVSYEDYKLMVGIFCSSFDAALRLEGIAIGEEYRQSVASRNKALTPVKGMALLRKAEQVLKELLQGLSVRWQDVSIAIALVTGRRMVEVHSTGRFEVLDGQALMFVGQAKARYDTTAKERPFEIPCLLPTDLVNAGINYLSAMRLDRPEEVNLKVSKPLQRQLKTSWDSIAGTTVTYKDLRVIYAAIAAETRRPKSMSQTGYLATILGHGENDVSTANSYQKFEIVDLG